MIILYISHLSTSIATGLNWSVPASVDAQSKVDEVLWVNMTDKMMEHWKPVSAHHNIREYGGDLKLQALPEPFKHPDVVVFEGFYYLDDVCFAKVLRKTGVPYIIVPRSNLTYAALHNHAWLKKKVAHLLFFDSFVKHATAIQYLTKQEAEDSVGRFNVPYFIIPNGFNTPIEVKTTFTDEGVKAVFIGRLEMFQKGLDFLLDAITEIKEKLLEAKFHLDIYGPHRFHYEEIGTIIKKRKIDSIVSLKGEVGGDDKKKVLLDSDLFIMTSRFEGHPMGLIEALAYGVPCLVTPGSNMLEEIKETDAGWYCKMSVESIKDALLRTINEKVKYPQKSKNAQVLARKYNWDDIAQKFHKEVINIIG